MAIYAMSDTHLCIETNKPMDIFGSRWSNWDKKIISGWLSTVTEKDTVIIPGDISWAMSLEGSLEDLRFIDRLPGKKILMKGLKREIMSLILIDMMKKNKIQKR